jgi:uncharacterized protein
VRQPIDVVRDLLQFVPEQRWDELPSLYAVDARVTHPLALPRPTALHGRAEIAAHFARAASLPLVLRTENVVIHEARDPEVVIAEFDYVGSNTATGASFRFGNVFVTRVRGGEIVESHDYSDHAVLAAAFGVLEAVGAGLQERLTGRA